MKKEKIVSVTICDGCGSSESVYYHCLKCGKDFCYECKSSGKVIEYKQGIYVSGSNDGVYCSECNAELMKNPSPLFSAYLKIAELRQELEIWSKDFTHRKEKSEAVILAERGKG